MLKKINHEINQYIGTSRGGKNTKIHAVVDDLGNPLTFLLTGGQVYDSLPAVELLQQFDLLGSNILETKHMEQKKFENGLSHSLTQ